MPTTRPDRAPRAVGSPVQALVGAVIGGAAYGLLDALRVIEADTVQASTGRALTLAAVDAAGIALAGLAAGVVALLLLRTPLASRLRARFELGLAAGMAAGAFFDVAEYWFSEPAPFAAAPPMLGNPAVFAVFLVVLVLAVLAAGLQRALGHAILTGAVLALGWASWSHARDVPPGGSEPAADAKNVLLVTLDTARADYFGAYGRTDVKTPHFDGLAAQGVRLDHAFSQIPVTGPSHTTMLTGEAPWEHGNLLNGLPIDPDKELLSTRLRSKGWRTAAFVSAYVLDGGLGFSRGFEVYDDDFGWLQGFDETVPGRVLAMAERFTDPDHVLERKGGRTVDAALRWMDAELQGGAPFFVWVHLFDAHGPYEPPPPWDTAYYQGDPRDPAHTSMQGADHIAAYLVPSLEGITDADYVLAQYAGEVSYADEQLGRLLDWLDRSGHADDTLVIAVADHGESLAGEHGVWFNHGDDLYEAATWIPWAMRFPDGAHEGEVLRTPAELTDLAPTIYDVLGLDVPTTVTGSSLIPAIDRGDSHRPFTRGMCFDRPINQQLRHEGVITKPTYRLVALRTPDHRFVDHEHESLSNEHWAITTDGPFHTEARAPISIPEENALEAITSDLLASGDVERSQAEQSADAIRKLQALGYMEE